MAIRGSRLIPSTVTKTLLCIDDFDGHEFSGRILNPYMPGQSPFANSKQMIDRMEAFFEEISFPQEYYTTRTFIADKKKPEFREPTEIVRYHEDGVIQESAGKITSILFQVQFRQNATWQGQVEWVGHGKARPFRSILELLHLIASAAEQCAGKPFEANWDD